ncbi:DNA-directed RNA polymerase subunit A'' [Candidatus Woesearchaeota archaeon]|nr:DNA-directed RNA polymerase subunit A'' [Candidatus Woesearchaeota archaeon]
MEELFESFKGSLPDKLLDDIKKELVKRKVTKKEAEEILVIVKAAYEKAKIHPGEAIGIITAESFGEPGTQMSVPTNELLIIKVNEEIKIIKIGKFVDNLIELKGSLKLNEHSEITPLNDLDIYVPSINQEEKIEWKKVIECSRHKHNNNLIKIKTNSGREITCTDNHSFVTRINNSIVPIKGSDLKLGNRIPVINKFPIENKSKLDLREFFEENYVFENENGFLETNHQAKPIPRFINLNKNTGWFIGAYLAEGCASGGHLGISNLNDNYINNAKVFVNNLGLSYTEDFHHRGFADGRDLKVNSTLLTKFIINTCNKGSDFKRVPQFAYSASDEFVAGLLKGYFDGDGNFHVDRKMIRASSNSKELTDGIALLLSRFKIFSYKVKDRKGQHWLLIPYKYAPLYLTHIGSDIDYKFEALEKLAEKAKRFWNEKSQDYTDMISGFDNILVDLSKKLGLMTRYVNSATKRQKIGRVALFRHIQNFKSIANQKNIDISKELKIMNRMFNSDVIWDEITNIEYVDYDREYVYDLSVPGLETFTTFDGIITHNTLNVFHFAGVAEVSVSSGLPRVIELFDARKTIKTPGMYIYLNSPHNKDPKKVKKIASLIKQVKLREIATDFSIDIANLNINVELNRKKMRDLNMTDERLIQVLTENIKDAQFKVTNDRLTIKLKTQEKELQVIYKLKEKIKDTYISGVENIEYVLPVKDGNEFIILTSGTNLKDVLKVKDVDGTRTITNDIFEIYKVLGIEATRQAIINETTKIYEDQGLDIDARHFMLIADIITNAGKIKGITRSGITSEKESVLARASFETPIKHIINASLLGEEDKLSSVIENVMLNQPVPLGTGLPDLVLKVAGLKEEKETKNDKE